MRCQWIATNSSCYFILPGQFPHASPPNPPRAGPCQQAARTPLAAQDSSNPILPCLICRRIHLSQDGQPVTSPARLLRPITTPATSPMEAPIQPPNQRCPIESPLTLNLPARHLSGPAHLIQRHRMHPEQPRRLLQRHHFSSLGHPYSPARNRPPVASPPTGLPAPMPLGSPGKDYPSASSLRCKVSSWLSLSAWYLASSFSASSCP